MMFMIILGASTFSKVLAFSGATTGLVAWVSTLTLAPVAALLTMFFYHAYAGCIYGTIVHDDANPADFYPAGTLL